MPWPGSARPPLCRLPRRPCVALVMEVTEIALIQKNLWPSETGYKGYMPVLIEIYHLQFNEL